MEKRLAGDVVYGVFSIVEGGENFGARFARLIQYLERKGVITDVEVADFNHLWLLLNASYLAEKKKRDSRNVIYLKVDMNDYVKSSPDFFRYTYVNALKAAKALIHNDSTLTPNEAESLHGTYMLLQMAGEEFVVLTLPDENKDEPPSGGIGPILRIVR